MWNFIATLQPMALRRGEMEAPGGCSIRQCIITGHGGAPQNLQLTLPCEPASRTDGALS